MEGPRDPAFLPGLELRAWRGLGSGSCPHWGLGLTGTGDLSAPHPTASHNQPVLSHLLQGATGLLGNTMKTRQLHGCPESGEGASLLH